jgi:UDP-N-acetylmuramoyl-L-alanyl-D-glutamate--2,6-diaminopimelate ligase
VEVLDRRGDPAAVEITALVDDSRHGVPGALFCCVVGRAFDGHQFAADAVSRGAVALLVERPLPVDVPQVVVPAVRPAMALTAAEFFGHPSRRLDVVGITGTNGKTTTAHLLGAIFEAAGRPGAVLGTLSGARTTPEAPAFQGRLSELVAEGAAAAAVEVSSHALDQHRVDGTWFEAAVFTNLSPDHLDYHATMDRYFQAKRALFEPDRVGTAVINADDPYGQVLLEAVRLPARPYSLADADGLEVGASGSSFRWEGHAVGLRLGGPFNVSNALAAATVARQLGIDARAVADGLSSVASVPGRFERVERGQPFLVIVDYAHTPAGLEQLLGAVRQSVPAGRVLVVFGCGGDRDREKRPSMGEVASRLADVAVLTSDNPRSEDPMAIIDEVLSGVGRPDRLVVEPDRRAAIARALGAAQAGDAVIIAGKGHEAVQVFGDRRLPFDDREVAAEELEGLAR